MSRPLDAERERRARLNPMWRYADAHKYLKLDRLIGSVSATVTRVTQTPPATPTPEPAVPIADAVEQLTAALDVPSLEAAAETADLDVRELLRTVRTGFARAVVEESDRVILTRARREPARRPIGFV